MRPTGVRRQPARCTPVESNHHFPGFNRAHNHSAKGTCEERVDNLPLPLDQERDIAALSRYSTQDSNLESSAYKTGALTIMLVEH